MARLLGRLLNIRPAEWPRLGWLYAMLLLALIGTVWGETIVEAAFLRQVGVQYLPLVISASAALQILAIAIYTVFADRVADESLLLVIVGISAAAIAVGLGLLSQSLIFLAYPLLYLVATVSLRFMLNVHWTTYVNGFYDTRSAKRIIPVLGSAARVASIVAGFSMPLLTGHLAPAGIIALWLLALLVALALVWAMPRALPDAAGGRIRAMAAHEGPLSSIRTGYRFVADSAYLRWLALAAFLMMVLLAYLTYQGDKILLDELGTVQRIADFTGLLNGLSNLVMLPFQLFLLSRLFGRIGLGNAELIFPGTTALSSLGLLFVPGLATAALAYVDRTTLRTSIFSAVDSLLYNAVPLRLRGRARAFISGMVVPVGTLCGGLLLSLWTAGAATAAPTIPLVVYFWPVLAGAVIFAYLASAWFVRQHYAHALVTMLEHDDLAFLAQQQAPDVALTDVSAVRYLHRRLAQPGLAPEMSVFLSQLLIQAGGPVALAAVFKSATGAADGQLRAQLVAVLATADWDDEATGSVLACFLADPDPRVRQQALAALSGLAGLSHYVQGDFPALVEGLLDDPVPAVRRQALAALAVLPGFSNRPAAVAALEQLLASPDPALRAQGLSLLGPLASASGSAVHLDRLLAALAEPADQVRLAAALALEDLCRRLPASRERIALAFIPAVHDPVERIRSAAVAVLGSTRSAAVLPALCAALADPSPAVQFAAVDVLARRGRAVLPALQPLQAALDPGLSAMAAVTLARINPRTYRPLVLRTYVAGDLQAIYSTHGAQVALGRYSTYRSVGLLRALVIEQNETRLNRCFFLLTALCQPADVRTIRTSLSSPERARRAGATEALEALTTPQTAQLLALWCDPERNDDRLRDLAQSVWGLSWPAPPDALSTLLGGSTNPFLHAVVCYAARELRAAIAVPLPQPSAEEENMLPAVERIIFLKEVPFFEGMQVEQLKILAEACEEEFFPADSRIFAEGDPGGVLYVVVSGRVALEQEKRRGSFARLATVEAGSYFGEMNLFDNSARATCALAVQDTLLLRLDRDPLMALARRNPDLSLALVNVLSVRLREAQHRIADLTRTRPKTLDRLYDELA